MRWLKILKVNAQLEFLTLKMLPMVRFSFSFFDICSLGALDLYRLITYKNKKNKKILQADSKGFYVTNAK
jgi:hypothetical protein